MQKENQTEPKGNKGIAALTIFRIVVCTLVIAAGVAGMTILTKMKKPPAEIQYRERPLQVETMTAASEDMAATIRGFGEVRSLNVVSVSSEVAGNIADIHPRLKPGEIIKKNELLFRIDSRNYAAAVADAQARISQGEITAARMKKEYDLEQNRLITLKRNRELAKGEFDRVRRLFEKDRVGTRSGVDMGEQAYNNVSDMADQLARQIDLYPLRIKEIQASLESARAQLAIAKANLDRCEVRSPFNGRVRTASAEKGQYVTPGFQILLLADDSTLEIQTPLDSRDVRDWLQFDGVRKETDISWFSKLPALPCQIRWTEDHSGHVWEGSLHRAVQFNPETRTLTVAVRISASEAVSGKGLPLVEGMFCQVDIPGRPLKDVIRIPRWAVSFKNTVFIAVDGRLKTVPVEVARAEGDDAFISKGISPGDQVIVTRLTDPLENSLLQIADSESKEKSS